MSIRRHRLGARRTAFSSFSVSIDELNESQAAGALHLNVPSLGSVVLGGRRH